MSNRTRRFLRGSFPWILAGGLALALIVVLMKDVDIAGVYKALKANATMLAVFIALSSLIVTAVSAAANWQANRCQATLDAWSRWSDTTVESRRAVSSTLGIETITREQAAGLARVRPAVTDAQGTVLSDEESLKIVQAMVDILNGLERMAVGVEQGVYKKRVLVDVGGTIIKRSYERFEEYIDVRRKEVEKTRRQGSAYAALERLVRDIRVKEVDAARLKSLRRRP